MNVTPVGSASTLAQTISGSGVTVSNASINCGNGAEGTFTYSGPNLGMTGGILLTNGRATDAANPGTFFCNVTNGNNFADPNLTAIVPSANLDVCILEFDFVPTCSSLDMTYVFGSEEYPTGVGGYNDAFAIFLTGPNPSGGNYAAKNIALLPNGTPVSINNVNAGTNTAYFHNNYTNPNNDVAYNGYTIPVTSVTSVVPCSTYHMKIAIADAGNPLYDSGVFISGNGISCQNPATVAASATPSSSCGNTGSASVSVTNYTGTPTYHWQPGGQTTSSINSLAPGTYTCVVSFQQSCGVITQTLTATVTSAGSGMVLTSSQQNLTCNGANNASATVSPIGGSAPYTCVWSTTPVQTGFTVNNLSAGTYTATVTDNGGCQNSIQIHIVAPPAMQLGSNSTPATCTGANGTASFSVTSGGTAPYTYLWNTTPPQHAQTATQLTTGIYQVTITGSNQCSVTGTVSVLNQNPTWSLSSATPTNVACFGGNNGALSVVINNPGSSLFNYTWNTNPPQNTQSIANLSAGSYTCHVSDNNGCVQTIVATVSQPALFTSAISSVPTQCTGSVGSVRASPVGGTPPYTYLWNTTPPQTTGTAHGLAQGQYSVVITDAHQCSTSSVAIVGTIFPTLQINENVVKSVCGGPSGSINIVSVNAGTWPFSYVWNTQPAQTTQGINNLLPGNYSVTVTDANGCVANSTISVGINNSLPVIINVSPDYCNKGVGTASAFASGNPPYQYQWGTSPAQTVQTANNLYAGNYWVHVTDAYNCKDSVVVSVINQNDVFTSTFDVQPGGELFAHDLATLSVGTNPGWNLTGGYLSDGTGINGVNTHHIFNQAGDYTATYYFTSIHGCKDSVTYGVFVKDFMTIYIPNSFSPNGDGVNDVFKAEGTLIRSFELLIYDRWDNLVIALEDLSQSWNGKYKGQDAPVDTYVYKATLIDEFGKQQNLKGQINLIR